MRDHPFQSSPATQLVDTVKAPSIKVADDASTVQASPSASNVPQGDGSVQVPFLLNFDKKKSE